VLGNGKEAFTTYRSIKEEVNTNTISTICRFFLFWCCLIAQALNGISLSNASTRHAGFSEDSYYIAVSWQNFGTAWYLEYRMTVYWYTDTVSGAVSVSNTVVLYFHQPLHCAILGA
jgi:hypothetical protein